MANVTAGEYIRVDQITSSVCFAQQTLGHSSNDLTDVVNMYYSYVVRISFLFSPALHQTRLTLDATVTLFSIFCLISNQNMSNSRVLGYS